MRDITRRRTLLGPQRSAAVPLMWEALERLRWSDARLGAEMRADSAAVSRLLYGDRKANRRQAIQLHSLLSIPLESWDQPTVVRRRKHRPPSLAPVSSTSLTEAEPSQAEAS